MPKGGARPGAGRPPGVKNTPRFDREAWPEGSVPVIPPAREVYRERLDAAASDEVQRVIERALSRINDVMEQRVHPQMQNGVLKAATTILEELRGPNVQRIQQTVDVNLKLADLVKMLDETERPGKAAKTIVAVPVTPVLPAKEQDNG